jgi:hypothetical protein
MWNISAIRFCPACGKEWETAEVDDIGDWMERAAIETFAEVAHNVWMHWLTYQTNLSEWSDDGEFVSFTKEVFDRWVRQMTTHYQDLTAEEKESDRKVAREVIQDTFDRLGLIVVMLPRGGFTTIRIDG